MHIYLPDSFIWIFRLHYHHAERLASRREDPLIEERSTGCRASLWQGLPAMTHDGDDDTPVQPQPRDSGITQWGQPGQRRGGKKTCDAQPSAGWDTGKTIIKTKERRA